MEWSRTQSQIAPFSATKPQPNPAAAGGATPGRASSPLPRPPPPPGSGDRGEAEDLGTPIQPLKLHVRNLSSFASDTIASNCLHAHFSRFGPVLDVKTLRNSQLQLFTYVTFYNEESAMEALNSGQTLNAKNLRAQRAKILKIQREEYREGVVKIFVGGIPSRCTERDFREYFEKWGKIDELSLPKAISGNFGFGFVTFQSTDSVRKIFETEAHFLFGKRVEVKTSLPRRENSPNAYLHRKRPRPGKNFDVQPDEVFHSSRTRSPKPM